MSGPDSREIDRGTASLRNILRVFAVTVRLLANMAITAMRGLRRPEAATGIAIKLYREAKNRFCRMVRAARKERAIASSSLPGSGERR